MQKKEFQICLPMPAAAGWSNDRNDRMHEFEIY